ncbi:LysR family transcriptional regulator [Marinospirillum sp.]|uniref:LysR family transcriptional regulator n=1 Tax=Marinospirillum sp. TaxID=2183934 RepID=UPI003A89DECD
MQDLAACRAFDALCRHHSLTAAALALGQPKSTLSRRLSQLEEELGQALVIREGQRLQLTEAGRVFALYCRQLIELAEQSVEALQELQEEMSGHLLLGMHSSLLRGWMTQVMDEFISAYPLMRLEVRTHLQPNAAEEIDLWLWLGRVDLPGYRRELLGRWPLGLYAGPGYLAQRGQPEQPRDLLQHAWVDLLGYAEEGLLLEHPSEGQFKLAPIDSRWRTDAYLLQIDALMQERGIGLLPIWQAQRFLCAHPQALIRCLPDWSAQAVELNCYYPKGRPTRKLKSFLKVLRASDFPWQEPTNPA